MEPSDHEKRNRGGIDDEDPSPASTKRRKSNDDDLHNASKHRQSQSRTGFSRNDYIVGWVCALHIEMAAAKAMLDDIHDSLPKDPNDSNVYILGSIGKHDIAIACLPTDGYGTNNAAIVASNMSRSFPSIRVRYLVGIGGGVPGKVDIRLGDVVVSTTMVQYDMGKILLGGRFERTGIPRKPPQELMTAVAKLRADHELESSKIPTILSNMLGRNPSMTKYTHRGPLQDWLFDSTYDHVASSNSCINCDKSKLVERPVRSSNDPRIYYGVIASGNQVIKDGKTRVQLAQELNNFCFEMEAAGLMDNFSCLVIRGICDYSDSHKNKQWQEYAAATAAAYAKELLYVIPADDSQNAPMGGMSISSRRAALQDRRNVLLESLGFESIDSRHSNIKAAYSKTCEWLLKHPDYLDWRDPYKFADHRGFLWINGKPGAGKSTLMKFVYSSAKKETVANEAVTSFFFNSRGEELEKSTMGMHRSLLLQLLEKFPDLQEVLDDPYSARRNHDDWPTWEIEVLQDLFSNAVAKLGQRRLTCFIDALDECDEDQVRDMVTYFEDLGEKASQAGTKLYICFSSRCYPYIEIQNGRQLRLEYQTGHGQDLEKYVRSNLRTGTSKSIEEVRSVILQKSAGVFMWVVLVVDILNKEFKRGRIFAVKKRLQEIPPKLSELFKEILRRDNENMADLLLCIQWILYAKRPLRREEFYFAVVSGLEPEADDLAHWDLEGISIDDINRFVLSSSKGLAEVTKSRGQTVQFIHESVRDFLVKDNGLRDLWPELGEDFQSLSHDRLKQCCYVRIRIHMATHKAPPETLPEASSFTANMLRQLTSAGSPFLEYATSYVLYHADLAAVGLPQNDFLKDFTLKDFIYLSNLFEKYEIRRHTLNASLLYIFAENNLTRLIRTTRHQLPYMDICEERYQYPLFAALANGHRDAIRALLLEDSSVPQLDDVFARLQCDRDFGYRRGRTPLEWAAMNGYVEIVRLLLIQDNTEINRVGIETNGRTPLLWAAVNGHVEVVKLLLAQDKIEINLSDSSSRTPLLGGAENGHIEVVKLLLARVEIDIHCPDWNGRTPLSIAAGTGHIEVIKLLLAQDGIDINRPDGYGRTPLAIAGEHDFIEVVKLLLAQDGIEINRPDRLDRTPLSLAAGLAHIEVVKLLLAQDGIEINRTDPTGRTPLSSAIRYNHTEVIQLLRAAGGIESPED